MSDNRFAALAALGVVAAVVAVGVVVYVVMLLGGVIS